MNLSFRNLKVGQKVAVFLSALMLVSVINYCGIVYFLSIQKNDAAVIDASGRNRMLTQRLAYFSERIAAGHAVQPELKATLELLDTSLKAIKEGGIAPGIAEDKVLPAVSAAVAPYFVAVDKEWQKFQENIRTLIVSPRQVDSLYWAQRDSLGNGQQKASVKVFNPLIKSSVREIEATVVPMVARFDTLTKAFVSDSATKQAQLKNLLLGLLGVSIAIIAIGLYSITRQVVNPVREISLASSALAQGDMVIKTTYQSEDEIGKALGNMKKLASHIGQAATFAEKIGNGAIDNDFKPMGEQDQLGFALVNMRDKLGRMAREDKRRDWTNQGISQFAELIQKHEGSLSQLADKIIAKLVMYLEANQGAIFTVNDDHKGDEHLELLSLYAWNKKRFQEKRIEKGEGITGQAWVEKETLYIRTAPGNFVEITSGLGHATPTAFLAVPLKVRDEIFGVLELAAFREYEKFERDFIEKIAETIASTLSAERVNERTSRLLEQAQQQGEELRAQEEEMRQNIEEMQATQEEIARKEREYVTLNSQLEAQLDKQNRLIEELRQELEHEKTRHEMERSLLRHGEKVLAG